MNVELILWVKVVRWEGGSWNPVHSASQQSEIDRRYLCGTGVENHRHGRDRGTVPLHRQPLILAAAAATADNFNGSYLRSTFLVPGAGLGFYVLYLES